MTLRRRFKAGLFGAVCLSLILLTACSEPIRLPPDAVLPDGSEYSGDIVAGVFHGSGRLQYPDGSYYQGQFENGYMQGRGVFTTADGITYRGNFVRGQADGEQVVKDTRRRTEYRGQVKSWRYHGSGTLTDQAQTYVGEFKAGVFDGLGQLTYTGGARYSGAFKQGKFHGQGVYKVDGRVYAGVFIDGNLDGRGTYVNAAGDIYIGEMRDWVPSGQGQLTDKEGNTTIGSFESGHLNGVGRYIGVDGTRYQGEFSYGEYQGQGDLTLSDRSHYVGEFRYGQYHGQGSLTRLTPLGTDLTEAGSAASRLKTQSGRWRNGVLVFDKKTGRSLSAQTEVALEMHQSLLDSAINRLQTTVASQINSYFLGVAGDGTQSVFRREIEFVKQVLQRRYDIDQRSISLINHHDSAEIYPLATTRSFATAVEGVAEKIDKNNDVLFVYLSSHGSKQHALKLDHDGIDLPSISAQFVAETLRNSEIKWKVVFVSACYSGGFIPQLDDGTTLILTAADANSTSFGCSEESEMTYFARALFKEVLANDDMIEFPEAFKKAQSLIAQWEKEESITPSNPMIVSPPAVVAYLRSSLRSEAVMDSRPHPLQERAGL